MPFLAFTPPWSRHGGCNARWSVGQCLLAHTPTSGCVPLPIARIIARMVAAFPSSVAVHRAPVLALWAAVVAARLGHLPDLALTLGQTVAGSRAKARRIGIPGDAGREADKRALEPRPALGPVRLLGKDIKRVTTQDGELCADDTGQPASALGVQPYLARAFGDRLGDVRAAMVPRAASHPPDELNRLNRFGFRLDEAFRPDVSVGAARRGATGEPHIERIMRAAGIHG